MKRSRSKEKDWRLSARGRNMLAMAWIRHIKDKIGCDSPTAQVEFDRAVKDGFLRPENIQLGLGRDWFTTYEAT